MSKEKTIYIAFPHGGTVPAALTGKGKDYRAAALEAVAVPESYGLQLIGDGFAVESVKGGGKPVADSMVPAVKLVAAEAKIGELQIQIAEIEKRAEAAEARVNELEAALPPAGGPSA